MSKQSMYEHRKGLFGMKKWKQKGIAFFTGVVLLLGVQSVAFAQELPPNTITVHGTGSVEVAPDMAQIYLSVEKTADTAQKAQSMANETIKSVINALKEMKVTEKDIITENVSVFPNYEYEENGKRIESGYRADTALQVTIYDVKKAGAYVDKALQAGATRVQNVSFTLSNPDAYYGRALQQAVKTAQNSAQVLATAYGKELVGVVSVLEDSTNRTFASNADYARAEGMAVPKAGGEKQQTEITYDDVTVEASIIAVYTFS